MPSRYFEPLEDYTTPGLADKFIRNKTVSPQLFAKAADLTAKLRSSLDEAVSHVRDDSDYSIYTGYCGIALYHFNIFRTNGDKKSFEIAKALVERALKNLNGRRISFLTGDAGPLAIAAVLYTQEGSLLDADDAIIRLMALVKKSPLSAPDEMLYGWAGYVYALHFVNSFSPSNCIIPTETVRKALRNIISSGHCLAQKRGVKFPPLMWEWHEKNYLGAAHGVAGILFMLLTHIGYANEHEKTNLIKPTLEWLVTQRYNSGNFMSSDGSREDRLVQWCHGAPGFTSLLILASDVFDDPNYMTMAIETGEITWKYGLLKKGYSLCHGVAGNAYVFLQLFQKTKEPKYLYRAAAFMDWCLTYPKCQGTQPDRPYSLFEGITGILYFFSDMEKPLSSGFPGFS